MALMAINKRYSTLAKLHKARTRAVVMSLTGCASPLVSLTLTLALSCRGIFVFAFAKPPDPWGPFLSREGADCFLVHGDGVICAKL